MRALAGAVAGPLRIGLMPTFTRAALAPTLQRFVPAHPDVRLHIVEGYSGILTEQVLGDHLDFAIVPAFEGRVGLKSRLILRDREVLISGPATGFKPLAPVRLADCAPLKIVAPGPDNVRRRNLEIYFQSNGVAIERMIEMDAMMATFDFVARSDFVTVLPGLICVNDIGKDEFTINPIVDPPLYAEFIVIMPARRTLSTAARLFLERFEADLAETEKRLTTLLKGGKAKRAG
jgi:DNA-binding transcriptional LysR family regulator